MQLDFVSPARAFFRATAWLFPTLLLVRLFEFLEYSSHYGFPEHGLYLLAHAAANDVLLAGALVTTMGVVFLALFLLLGIRATSGAITLFAALLVIASVLLSEYFVQARVPLGADLFGYSWHDISETVRTSSGLGSVQLAKLAVLAALIGVIWWYIRSYSPGHHTVFSYLASVVLAALAYMLTPGIPSANAVEQSLSENKLHAFLNSSFKHLQYAAPAPAPQATSAMPEYPLLKPADQPDVLGTYFNQAEAPPNIVVITVEGLGQTFMPGGRFAGFVPFISALSEKSLYFPNFLATSGRTFGFLPSFLGSLPPGTDGFMSAGIQMPAHDTLISLLKRNHYLSNYFVGFEASFDGGDVFLERQGIDHILYKGNFGPGYQTMEANEGGFSWGYADADLFKRAQEYLATADASPRLDMYHTVNLHEPFKVPDTATWQKKLDERLTQQPLDRSTRAEIEHAPNIFRALLYTDDAVQLLLTAYAKREDFARTIFIITGDHRLIPLPEESQLDRFSVPLIIWSPLLKHPVTIPSVSTHADVTPSLIAYLRANYHLDFPAQTHWLGTGLDMSPSFRSTHSLALMRIKNSLNDYLAGEYFLSDNVLYRLLPGLQLERFNDAQVQVRLENEFSAFKAVNRYVMQNNKIRPDVTPPDPQLAQEQALINRLNLQASSPTQTYTLARKLLLDEKRYDDARLVARHALRESPNFHDMRMLLGRSYAWQGNHAAASQHYQEVIRRNPAYTDAYSALADLALWSDRLDDALAITERGLAQDPKDTDLLLHKARAQQRMQHYAEARITVGALLQIKPDMVEALALKKSLPTTH
jgi:phosphoglycerol transferase MdoB-like AlkP superfamily enzyme/Flp pilus assembly protein TadD